VPRGGGLPPPGLGLPGLFRQPAEAAPGSIPANQPPGYPPAAAQPGYPQSAGSPGYLPPATPPGQPQPGPQPGLAAAGPPGQLPPGYPQSGVPPIPYAQSLASGPAAAAVPGGADPGGPPQGPRPPVFRRWWFWAVVILALIAAGIGVATLSGRGDGEPGGSTRSATPRPTASPTPSASPADPSPADPSADPAADPSADVPTDAPTEPAPQGPTRDNSTAVAATLPPGKYTVGAEIQPGHYEITADGDETGNLRIASPTDPFKANELLGEGEFALGAARYVTDLDEGDELIWDGVGTITLRPAETKLSNELSPGNYIVGLDIPAGGYLAEATGDWSGNLLVYSTDGQVLVNAIIGRGADPATVEVTLEDGQRVDISGVTTLKFKSL
jgi:hypothetical protein